MCRPCLLCGGRLTLFLIFLTTKNATSATVNVNQRCQRQKMWINGRPQQQNSTRKHMTQDNKTSLVQIRSETPTPETSANKNNSNSWRHATRQIKPKPITKQIFTCKKQLCKLNRAQTLEPKRKRNAAPTRKANRTRWQITQKGKPKAAHQPNSGYTPDP